MEVECPACGLKHNTEDYPGAFEIPCSCGYPILLPGEDEAPLTPDSLDPAEPFANAPPLSFEAQDRGLVSREPPKAPIKKEELIRSVEMTSPEDLPSEMPYDPYELEPGSSESQEEPIVDSEEPHDLLSELEEELDQDAGPPPAPMGPPGIRLPGDVPPPLPQAFQKQLLNRLQTASIGRFVGSSYNIEIVNLDNDKRMRLLGLVESFLENQAWLAEELNRREINLKNMLQQNKFENVPEGLAVEIYLRTYELGGLCNFEKTNYTSAF